MKRTRGAIVNISSDAGRSQWQGNVFVGALKSMELVRLELRDGKVVSEERLFGDALKKRIRAVVNSPGGTLYLLTDDSNGLIVRVSAVS